MSEAGQAIGLLAQGEAAKSAGDLNTQLAIAKGQEDAARIREVGEKQQGKIISAIGKAGVTMSGSAKVALAEAIRVNKEDVLQTQFNAEREAIMQRHRGRAARIASRISAATTLVQGGLGAYIGYEAYKDGKDK
jgi:hypothetical protein